MAADGYNPAKDFIDTQDYDRAEIEGLLDLIALLKDADRDGACPELLKDLSLGMIFEEPSTRTRVSFEVAMVKLGGHALYLRPGEIHMGVRESLYDTAKVLSRMVDVMEARTLKHATLVRGESGTDLLLNDKLEAAAGVKQPLVEFAKTNSGVRIMDGRFMEIRQAMGTPKQRYAGREAVPRYLHAFVEEMKASGFVANALERSNQPDAMVAPPAA